MSPAEDAEFAEGEESGKPENREGMGVREAFGLRQPSGALGCVESG